MKTELENLTDAQLSEAFAVEVAGWSKRNDGWFVPPSPTGLPWIAAEVKSFASSADYVMPFMNQHTAELDHSRIAGWHVRIYQGSTPRGRNGYDATQPTFARAACIALIKAKRSSTA
jgi:hypothetical protein